MLVAPLIAAVETNLECYDQLLDGRHQLDRMKARCRGPVSKSFRSNSLGFHLKRGRLNGAHRE